MSFSPVIHNLETTDLYKLTMMQVMLHQSPGAMAEMEFRCRNVPRYPLARLKVQLLEQLEHLCSLSFSEAGLCYLATKSFFKADFLNFLRLFRLQMCFVSVVTDGDDLVIRVKGPHEHITLFEIPVLAIVSELYFRAFDQEALLAQSRLRLAAKIEMLKAFKDEVETSGGFPFEIFDMSLRRRWLGAWQEEMVSTLAREVPWCFRGTSNVDLACRLNLPCFGTMAHEAVMRHQQLKCRLVDSQKSALEEWAQEYRGELGIALTDTISTKAFLRDYDRFFAALFDGVRNDSGDPYAWGESFIAHYKKLRIEPSTKRLVFSNSLDIVKPMQLWRHFAKPRRAQTGFGIGTHLGNDTGIEPLNIVMKLVEVNGKPVAKISDDPGKSMCRDQRFLDYLCNVFEVDAQHAAAAVR